MTDLIIWLRAQLDEDERVALATPERSWTVETEVHRREPRAGVPDEWVDGMVKPYFVDMYEPGGMTFAVEACEHAARWDPARVLVEVATKRRIINYCEAEIRDGETQSDGPGVGVLRTILLLMATAYADHPDYAERCQAWSEAMSGKPVLD